MLKRTLAGGTLVEMEIGKELGGGIEMAPAGLAPTLMDERDEVEAEVLEPDAIHSCDPGTAANRLWLLDRCLGAAALALWVVEEGAEEGDVSPSLDMASSPLSNEVPSVEETAELNES